MNRIIPALGLAAVIIATALAASYAKSEGMISPDLGDRIVMVVVGLVLVVLNNAIPKQLAPPQASARAEALGQSVRRVFGWTMTLGGLAWAAIWAFAPMAVAKPLAIAAMVSAMAIALGYLLWAMRRRKHPENA